MFCSSGLMSDSVWYNNFVRYDVMQVDACAKAHWCVKLGFLFSANAVIPAPPRQNGGGDRGSLPCLPSF